MVRYYSNSVKKLIITDTYNQDELQMDYNLKMYQIVITLHPLVGSNSDFKLKIRWLIQTIMLQMKMTFNKISPTMEDGIKIKIGKSYKSRFRSNLNFEVKLRSHNQSLT